MAKAPKYPPIEDPSKIFFVVLLKPDLLRRILKWDQFYKTFNDLLRRPIP